MGIQVEIACSVPTTTNKVNPVHHVRVHSSSDVDLDLKLGLAPVGSRLLGGAGDGSVTPIIALRTASKLSTCTTAQRRVSLASSGEV